MPLIGDGSRRRGGKFQQPVNLNKLKIQAIAPATPSHLMVGAVTVTTPESSQTLLEQLQTEFDIQAGEVDMLIVDMPSIPLQESPVIIAVAESEHTKTQSDALYGVIGACTISPTFARLKEEAADSPFSGGMPLYPEAGAGQMFPEARDDADLQAAIEAAKIEVIQEPQHGTITKNGSHNYMPKPGYVGNDKVVFLVTVEGHKIKVVEFIKVIDINIFSGKFEQIYKNYCSKDHWRISSSSIDAGSIATELFKKGINLDQSNVNVTFSNLPSGTLGQTTGTTITLDTNAAGHGWFIDYTPYLNEEFLPTANPDEWVARPGSEAEGKMDLLSVLWHEYGHALGLEHSRDAHDYMGATLSPGMRRLPTVEETAALQGLLAKGSSSPLDPDPSPGAPLPVTFLPGYTRLGRSRNSRADGGTDTGSDSLPSFRHGLPESGDRDVAGPLHRPWPWMPAIPAGMTTDLGSGSIPRYQAVANPTLTHGDLNSPEGWATHGSVAIGDGKAVLQEVSTSQTRLNQVFLLGEDDRFIRFTLDGISLDDQSAGPDDAFEVGLLDAANGASLAGPITLGRTDLGDRGRPAV